MKREIKFRAWDNKNKVIVAASYGDWVSFDGILYTEASRVYNTPNIEIERTNDYILMQFTGLLDKQGREIYEGDIVKYGNDEPSTVIFDNQMFCVPISGSNHKTHLHIMGGINKWEVIGNIYENSELIK